MSTNNGSEQCVTLHELNLRSCPQVSEGVRFGQCNKRTNEAPDEGWKQSKRQRLRQTRLHSEPYHSPRSSRRSTPSVTVISLDSKENGLDDPDDIEYLYSKKTHRHRDLIHNDLEDKLNAKSSYLFTPPPTVSDCSPNGSSIFDGHSVTSTAGYSSSPRSDNDDEIYANKTEDVPGKEIPTDISTLNCFGDTIIKYPQTLELYPESLESSWIWNLFPPNGNALMINDLNLACCSDLIGEVDNTLDTTQDFGCWFNFDITNLSSSANFFHYLDRPLGSPPCSATPQIRYVTDEQPIQVIEQIQLGDSLSCSCSELEKPKIPSKGMPEGLSCSAPGSQTDAKSDPAAISKSTGDSKATDTESNSPQASINIFMKKGSIENWNLGVPEDFKYPENVEGHSPSTSILMTAAEEDLEERVSHALSGDPALAEILLPKLKAKLSFILPLFCEEEECSLFEFSPGSSYFGHERGTARKRTSGSTPSIGSKSTTGTSITTPATSADSGKDFDGDDDDDEMSNSRKRSEKRPRLSNSRHPGDQERLRLRCHFHAKCPNTHIQKTCIMSGWLSIHNLRGHYVTHHTIIRCNKCFQNFDRKTEKNQHQRTCAVDASPPILEVIDCDKTDELDEVLNNFRTWRLENEEDEEMKNWIIKYKVEFVKNNMPSDDLYDSRELAKWYRMWRILFPSLETPVPSPFQSVSILLGDLNLERCLEVFQAMVESQVEHDQPPPADIAEQIEYYKDAIRKVYQITAPAPGSNAGSAGSMSEASHPVDGRSISTPADSTATAAQSRATAVNSNPSPHPRQHRRQKIIQEATPRTPADSQLRPTSTPTPATFTLPLTLSSVRSPCSADIRGAEGESPVVMRSGELTKSSGREAPPTHNPPDFQIIPQNLHSVPSQHEAARLTRSATHPGTMMPPPSRGRVARSFDTQNLQQQSMQHLQNRNLIFTPSTTPSEFPSGAAASLFNFPTFSEMLNVGRHGTQPWQNVPMPQERPFISQFCLNTGQITIDSRVEPCYSCQPAFPMQY